MALKRLMAIIAACVMIVGAFVIRNWIDNDGSITLGAGDAPIFCDSAIADACRAAFAEVTIADPGKTFDRLLNNRDPEPFVWVAADIWFDMLDDEAARGTPAAAIGERSDVLVTSPLVFAGEKGVAGCPEPSWACLAEPGLRGKLGITNQRNTSSGLLAFGQLAFERSGRAPGVPRWNDNDGVSLVVGRDLDLLNYRTVQGKYDLVVVTEAALLTEGPLDAVALPSADGGPTVEIQAAAFGGVSLPKLSGLAEALTDDKWQPGASPAYEGPTAGVLIGLRS